MQNWKIKTKIHKIGVLGFWGFGVLENMDLGKDYELASSSSEESDLSALCGDIDLDAMDEDGEHGPKSYLKT